MKGPADVELAHIAPVPRISLQAFCESPESARIIQTAATDRRMERAHVSVHLGGALAAIEAYRDAPTPNVIVLDSASGHGELLSHIEALAEFCDSGTKVVVAGRTNGGSTSIKTRRRASPKLYSRRTGSTKISSTGS
jgi:pilus assembly protein CpaE